MTAMTDEDRNALDGAPSLMLAEWWCRLNKGEWPTDGLGQADPEVKPWRPNTRRDEIMNWISGRIGISECLREWNRETLPGDLFDAWWKTPNVRAERGAVTR